MEVIISEYFLLAVRNAAANISNKNEKVFLEKPFKGFYVTFANQKIDPAKIFQTSSFQSLLGRDGPDIIVVCDDLLGPSTH